VLKESLRHVPRGDTPYRQVDLMVDSHSGLVDGYDYKRKEFVYGQVDSLGNIEMRGSRTRTTQTIDALDLSNYR